MDVRTDIIVAARPALRAIVLRNDLRPARWKACLAHRPAYGRSRAKSPGENGDLSRVIR